MAERFEIVEKALVKMLEDKKYVTLRDILLTMYPSDIAAIFSNLEEKQIPLMFRLLSKEQAAETFVEMDPDAHTVTAAGQRVELTLKEFDLLRLFLGHPGRVYTRDQLLEKVWGGEYFGETRTVDVHIGTLRTKLGDCGRYIRTVRGVGYRMEERK